MLRTVLEPTENLKDICDCLDGIFIISVFIYFRLIR